MLFPKMLPFLRTSDAATPHTELSTLLGARASGPGLGVSLLLFLVQKLRAGQWGVRARVGEGVRAHSLTFPRREGEGPSAEPVGAHSGHHPAAAGRAEPDTGGSWSPLLCQTGGKYPGPGWGGGGCHKAEPPTA